MTYASAETSVDRGSPIELYEFVFGPNRYRYVSGAEPVEYLGQIFEPFPITRGPMKIAQPLTVRSSRQLPVAEIFRTRPPPSEVSLNIRRKHLLDPDGQFIISWQGRVLNVSMEGNEAVLRCENDRVSMKRQGLTRRYQVSCPHALYGVDCGVNAADFAVPVTSYTLTGLILNVPDAAAFEPNYFAGGYIQYTNPQYNVEEFFSIRSSNSGNLSLVLVPPLLAAPMPLTLYPGCDQTYATCGNRFNNKRRYGGQLFIPNVNPMMGGMIF